LVAGGIGEPRECLVDDLTGRQTAQEATVKQVLLTPVARDPNVPAVAGRAVELQ